MSSWKSYKLGDIAEITSSKRIFYSEYVPSGIPFWRSKEIIEKFNRKNISTDLFISNEKYQEIKSKFGVPQQNDILLTSVGTLGIPYLVQSDEQFYFKDGNLTWIKNINNELLNPLFLFKWLASSIGRESLSEITIGSTQEALTISGLKTLELLLPPLEEQKAIAEVLSSLDDKIDLLHRQNQTLESLAQTLFRQWFIEEAKEEWEEVLITDLFEVRDGTHDSPKQKEFGKKLLTSKHILKNKLDFESSYFISEEDFEKINQRSIVEQGDILFSMIGTIGLTYLEQSNEIDYAIKNIGLFKTSQNKKFMYFVYLWLNSSFGVEFIHENRSGSTQEYISLGSLRNIIFNLPNYKIIDLFNEKMEPIFEKINTNMKQIKSLENLLDTLLPKLLSGEVKIRG